MNDEIPDPATAKPSPSGGETPAPPDALYQELIGSHSRKPRNYGEVDRADVRIHADNPTCGDEIVLTLRMENDLVAAVGFTGEGCSISRASASMMTTLLQGRSLPEADALSAAFRELVRGRVTPGAALGDLRALGGVARFPVRVRCALLAWNALDEAAAALREAAGPERRDQDPSVPQ